MSNRLSREKSEAEKQGRSDSAGVIDLVRLRSRTGAARNSFYRELEEIRLLLDQGQAGQAQAQLNELIKSAHLEASLLAETACLLSASLEMQGSYREALEAVVVYEPAEARLRLNPETRLSVRVHLGLAYNYTADHPRAIAVLNAALRDAAEEEPELQTGEAYIALARVYRSINEYNIARNHAQKALESFRHSGDWRGLAESYFAIAMADYFEGRWEDALNNFEQARSLIGDRPAPYLLGKIYNNLAGTCGFLKKPHEGICYLEKAIECHERTDHKTNAMDAWNNLGELLILVGEWERAQQALERALTLASQIEKRRAEVAMILDALGKLQMLRGEFEEAESNLQQAVSTATEAGNKWYEGQTLRTLGQCHLLMNQTASALDEALRALALGERIGDRQAICESRVLLAEAQLLSGKISECSETLQLLTEITKDSSADLGISGDVQRLQGLLALEQQDAVRAAQHFGRSLSIFEMLGDRYRSAQAHAWLARASASTQPERAAEHFQRAIKTFQELGAHPALARAEAGLAALDHNAPARQQELVSLWQLLTVRLTEAATSRELLLRELAAVIREETKATHILLAEPHDNYSSKITFHHGWSAGESERLLAEVTRAENEPERAAVMAKHDLAMIALHPAGAKPATVLLAPRAGATLPAGLSLEALLRVVELGMNACAQREGARAGTEGADDRVTSSENLMPGFIHSSPAMTRVVEEIHRIRSSDVTALITGESGTGKELVARAIHALSSRRSKVFVPFNCTAVPRELSEAYLFGYKRGAFTGAVADSAGVIRAAEGGTLFLDEIGDLPLDIQPKLLRFLQEGEIQPLGEQRPTRVNVRVIAATNTDLEEMVTAGRFREDLYYRLNVIRLQVPPLRERRAEIPAIVNHYIQHYAEKFGRGHLQISSQALDLLMVCDWPGNVRQLTNEIQRIVARAEDSAFITPQHLSPELRRTAPAASFTSQTDSLLSSAEPFWRNLTLAEAIEHVERQYIAEVLKKHKGNISRTARELEMTRRGLQLKLIRLGLSANQ